MPKLNTILIVALFSSVAYAARAADNDPAPTVQDSYTPVGQSVQGESQNTGTGPVEEGVPAEEGRGDPSGGSTGEPVTSPTPTGQGRGDNQ